MEIEVIRTFFFGFRLYGICHCASLEKWPQHLMDKVKVSPFRPRFLFHLGNEMSFPIYINDILIVHIIHITG